MADEKKEKKRVKEFGLREDADPVQAALAQPDPVMQALLGVGRANGNDQTNQLLQTLVEQWRPPETTSEKMETFARLSDPVGYANKARSVPGFEWNDPKGAFYNRPKLSPEATLASQGLNATNQWAQRGGVEGIDPAELAKFNDLVKQTRKTYV
jgi:hypothetical protein